LKLLFVIKSLNVVGGGAERVLVDVANGLVARGHEVKVLTFDPPGEAFYGLDPRIERTDTGIGQPGRSTPRLGFVMNIPRIRRAVVEKKVDLVIAFMHSTYVPVAAALLGTGTRLVFSEHIDAAHYAGRPFQRMLVRLGDRLAIAKTVPSAPLREEHPPAARRKVHVMPNAVDLATFMQRGREAPRQPPVLLTIGRFMAQKNHIELLQAFARLAPQFPDWTLRIVGEGELRPQLEAEIARLGLQERAVLPGVTRDVASEYAAASFVVLPSLYESFGLVAAEALASSRAVLAFDSCVGVAEMVRDEVNGLLVSASGDRVADLAAGLARLMQDAALRSRLGAAGPASVSRYALEGVLNAWEALLVQLDQHGGLRGRHQDSSESGRSDDRLLRR
jgi:GalNAc-alpha-(1->4)-GalNAc-alpha-(1->3)-diNAcBac-PP-undecaprenol alpha-1,4-N-acetyl-D-galactosaminyltransferase